MKRPCLTFVLSVVVEEETDMTIKTQLLGRPIKGWLWAVVLVAGVCLLAPAHAQANPSFARRFDAKCTMCHSPLPPRLNNLGIIFKRLGYRLPDADPQGVLILQDTPNRALLDNFSLIGDVRLENLKGKPTSIAMHEVELVGAGSLNKYLSFATEFAWDVGELGMEQYEAQLLFGRPSRNFTARFGMMSPLLWDKFGHQRLGIARAHVLNSRVSAGKFVGYRPRDNQEGVEIGANFTSLGAEGGTMRSTFLSAAVFNGLTTTGNELGENNKSKDVLAQVHHVWGENHTIGALWYRGRVTNIDTTANADTYSRWGVFGNYELRPGTDALAGFMAGRDDTTSSTIGRISSRSWFAELNQTIAPRTAAFARYDRFEPRRPSATGLRRGMTVGVSSQTIDNLLITAEYTGQKTGTGTRGRDIIVRVIVIY